MRDYTMGMPDIEDYATLRKHFDQADAFRGSKDKPFGKRKYSNRRMRERPDGSIALEYMGSELIAWHPDGTISVRAFDSKRQGVFDRNALPQGIQVGIGNRTGPLIYIFTDGTDNWWISTPKPKKDQRNQWDTHTYTRNTNVKVLQGKNWVHMHKTADGWRPVDEASLEPFKWYEPDKSRTRKVSAEYNIPDFICACRAMIGLDAADEIGTATHSRWSSVRGKEDELLQCLKDRNFPPVYSHIRRVERSRYDALTGHWVWEKGDISSTDVKALRDRVYVLTGICQVQSERIVGLDKYGQIERRLKDFGQP